jgi:hypothetical protein
VAVSGSRKSVLLNLPPTVSVRSVGSAKKGAKLEIPPQLLAKRYIFLLSSGRGRFG